MTDLVQPFVSVIIPVFNDRDRLELCLEALSRQTYGQRSGKAAQSSLEEVPRSPFEIIVVDNGSAHPDQIREVVDAYENTVFASEPTPGSYAARNRGLAFATGEILAFTDADCIPAPDWIERGVFHLLQVPNCGQVVGKVDLFFADPQRPTAVELYESLTAFPQERLLQEFHGGATANVFTWRRVVDDVGAFNPRLKSNGDLEWGKRVFLSGYSQVYAADVRVEHPSRRSWQELHKRTIRLAGGRYDLQQQQVSTGWQRHLLSLGMLLPNLVPPVFFLINTLRDTRLSSVGAKLKVVLVMVSVRYISAWETLRLWLGGVSSRA